MGCLKDEKQYVFNLTMSYQKDSDVRIPYGWIVDKRTLKPVVFPRNEPLWCGYKKVDRSYGEYFDGKTKIGVFAAQNCKSGSKREVLVQNLKEHLEIDIFGKCGTPFANYSAECVFPEKTDYDENVVSNCMKHLERDYYFFFALENNVCEDYVSEKLFFAAQHRMVPVVLKRAIARGVLPDEAFIAADDYSSLLDMANDLRSIAESRTRYLSYFRWTRCYRSVVNAFHSKDLSEPLQAGMCDLCRKVLNMRLMNQQKVLKSVEEWYRKNGSACEKDFAQKLFAA